jgi:hypothetical protein
VPFRGREEEPGQPTSPPAWRSQEGVRQEVQEAPYTEDGVRQEVEEDHDEQEGVRQEVQGQGVQYPILTEAKEVEAEGQGDRREGGIGERSPEGPLPCWLLGLG